jgi:hypothetical protein
MPEFTGSLSPAHHARVLELTASVLATAPDVEAVTGESYAMEPADAVVLHQVDLNLDEGRLRVGMTKTSARPPFEWLAEITSDMGESAYWRHYLVRETDIVLALRRDLTPINDVEAQTIISELESALRQIQ